jgi:hypothetical protein
LTYPVVRRESNFFLTDPILFTCTEKGPLSITGLYFNIIGADKDELTVVI